MKYFLLVAVLAVVLPVYGQNKTPDVQPPAVGAGASNQAPADPQTGGTPGEPKGYFSRLFSPENLPAFGVIVVGIVGIWVAIDTLNHMRESTERQLRAYVLPDTVSIFDGTTVNPPQPARANIPGVPILIKNSGQTPAYRVVSYGRIAVILVADENTMLVVPDVIPEQFANTLGPGAIFNKAVWFDRPLVPNEIADIAAGTRAIYFFGRIEYLDAFGKRRFTNFRLRYTGQYPPSQNAIFNFSERGNDAN